MEKYGEAKDYGDRSLAAAQEAGDGVWQLNSSVLVAQAQSKSQINKSGWFDNIIISIIIVIIIISSSSSSSSISTRSSSRSSSISSSSSSSISNSSSSSNNNNNNNWYLI